MDVTLVSASRGRCSSRIADSVVLDYVMFKMTHVAAESLMGDKSPFGKTVFDLKGHDAVHEWTFPLAAGKSFALSDLAKLGDKDESPWTNPGKSLVCMPSFLTDDCAFRMQVQSAAVSGFMKRRSLQPRVSLRASIAPLRSWCLHRDTFVVPMSRGRKNHVLVATKKFPGFSDYCLFVHCADGSRWSLFPTTNPWQGLKTRSWASLGKFLRSRMGRTAAIEPTCVILPRFQELTLNHGSMRLEGATLEVDGERAVMVSDSTIELTSSLDAADPGAGGRLSTHEMPLVFSDSNKGLVAVCMDRPVHVYFEAMRGRHLQDPSYRRAALW